MLSLKSPTTAPWIYCFGIAVEFTVLLWLVIRADIVGVKNLGHWGALALEWGDIYLWGDPEEFLQR